MTLLYVILAVVAVGIVLYLFIKKKGPSSPQKPQGPVTPPQNPQM